ncbi:T3SS effector HopA1 family protein [Streptomyces osmaniensis]|uniref:T3SS effector HopA1 family protein n=1 Tax=Streptomyces osmaniensis TaxID=593134 RepID=UPI0031FCCC72
MGESTISRDSLEALRGPLSQAVYEVLHAGRRGGPVRSKSLREARLTQQLAAATPHRTTYARARVVEAASACNTMVVELCDVRVSVPAETIRSDDGAVQPGDWVTVELPTARPALCPGFFLTDGFLGRPVHPPLLRIYVHLTEPGSAPAVWHQALSMLEEKRVRYRAKILSLPRSYPRTDSLVFCLGTDAWDLVPDLPRMLKNLPGTGSDTSVFARPLAPGIAMAWEPADDQPGRGNLSYGKHRSAALTDALIRHAGGRTAASLDGLVHESLLHAGVDPLAPERNTGSPELELPR